MGDDYNTPDTMVEIGAYVMK